MTREPDLRVPAPRLEPDDAVVGRLASLAVASRPARRTRRSALRVGLASLGATAVLGAGAVTAGALTGHLDPFAPTEPRSPAPGPVERPGAPDPSEPSTSETDPPGATAPTDASDATSDDAASRTDPGRRDRAPGQQIAPPGQKSQTGRRRGHGAGHPAHGDREPAGPNVGSSSGRGPGRGEAESPGRGPGVQPGRPDRPGHARAPERRAPAPAATPRRDVRGTGWATTR